MYLRPLIQSHNVAYLGLRFLVLQRQTELFSQLIVSGLEVVDTFRVGLLSCRIKASFRHATHSIGFDSGCAFSSEWAAEHK